MPTLRRTPLALCALALALAAASPALGARAFAPRFTTNTTGGLASTANTLMTCPATDVRCADAQAGRKPLNNNDFAMVRVDVDGDPATFDSSRARLTLPPTATVLFAALYVAGDTSASGAGAVPAPNPAARGTAKLMAPGDAAYRPLTAVQVDDDATRYQSVFDVTPIVAAAGAGTYTVADVQTGTGLDRYGGWSLIVAYRDPTLPARNLAIFDGYVTVSRTAPVQTITLKGFQTPPSGPVQAVVGILGYEGDLGSTGDTVTLNDTPITDAFSPANNFFNSTITTFGTELAGREPSYRNQLGFDNDVLREDGVLANGATSASIRLTTAPNGETYFTGAVTFRADLFSPDVVGTKSRVDLTPPVDQTRPGDTLRYTVRYENRGLDAANALVVRDAIPPGTDYVPGSLRLTEGPGAGTALTDGAGDDVGEFDAGGDRIVVRPGAGANAQRGGRLAPGAAAAFTFDVRVRPDARDGQRIDNGALANFIGETLGSPFVDIPTNVVTDTVTAPDLAVDKSHEGGFVAGDPATFFINVRNSGSLATDGSPVIVTDTLPPDAFSGIAEAGGSGWACDVAGLAVTCRRAEPLAAGDSYPPVKVVGTVADPVPPSIVNVASVAGGGDSNPDNNTGSDVGGTAAVSDLRVTKTPDADVVPSGGRVTYTIVVTNEGPSTADAVVLDDPVDPAAFTDVTPLLPAGSPVSCTAAVHCDIGSLKAGSSVVIPVQATVTANNATLVNTATVSSPTPDPTPFTRTTTATIRVPNTVDVSVAKTALTPTVAVGGAARFRLSLSNAGPGVAHNVIVRDRLPAGFQVTSATGPGVTCILPATPQDNLGCLLPALAPAAGTVAIDVVGTIAPGAAGQTLSNGVEVSADERESDITNNSATATLQVLGAPDLQLFKQAVTALGDPLPGPLLSGAQFVYRLTVNNAGPGAAPGVTISDPLPPGLQYVGASAPGCTAPGGLVTCPLGTLAAGAQAVVDLTVQVAPGAAQGTLTNSATVSSDVPDSVPGNNASAADISVGAAADLSLLKTVTPGDVHVGDLVTFTLTATNLGPDGTGATVTDVPPPGLQPVSGSPECSLGPTGVVCPLGDLPAGASRTLIVTARVLPEAAGLQLVNRSAVSSVDGPSLPRLPELNPGDESAGATLNVAPVANLRLAKRADVDHLSVGAQATYTLTATNDGPDPASGVVMEDTLPANVVYEAGSDGCQEQAGVVRCQVGDVPVGASVERDVVVRPLRASAGTTLVNAATVAGAEDDLDPADNAAVIATPRVDPLVDLSVAKTADTSAPPSPGRLVYTVTVGNAGPSAATGVALHDPLPAGLVAVSALAGQGSCTTGADVTCALGTIPPGGAVQALLTVQVPAGLAGRQVVNTATASSDEPEDTPDDNAASAAVTPVPGPALATAAVAEVPHGPAPAADLAVTKTALDAHPAVDGTVSYRIVVTNRGPAVATGVRVTDRPGAGLTILSAPGCAGAPLVCSLPALGPGSSEAVLVRARVTRAGGVQNAASVSGSGADPAPRNNRAAAVVHASAAVPRLSLTHRASRPVTGPGGTVRFTTTVSARGDGAARHVRVCVALPPGLSPARTPDARREAGRACRTVPRVVAGRPVSFTTLAVAGRVGHTRTVASVATLAGGGQRRRAVAPVTIFSSAPPFPAVTG